MDPTLLSLIVQAMMSDSSNASKGTNTAQDLLFQMLLDPKFGVLTGTYDPMLTVQPADPASYAPTPEVGMPIASNYMRQSGTMAQIASGLTSGNLSYDGALRTLQEALANSASDVYGQNEQDLKDEVSKIRDEVNSYAQQVAAADFAASQPKVRDDLYAQMGLPSPTEQYTGDTVGKSAGDSQMMADLAQRQADYARRKSEFDARGPKQATIHSAGRRGSPSVAANNGIVGDGAPMSRDEAIRLAKAAGADPDLAAKWWDTASTAAFQRASDNGDLAADGATVRTGNVRTPSKESTNRYLLKYLPSIWQDIVQNAAEMKTGNPMLDAGSSGRRNSAQALLNYKADQNMKPRDDSFNGIDPAWIKQKRDLEFEGQRLANGQSMLDYRAMGRAAAANSLGNSPYSDAMKERSTQLLPMLQMMLNQK